MHFTYDQLQTILKNESCPAAFCDLEAFDQNLKWLGRALESTNKKVRLGTKSIRIPALINRALQQPYVNGLMIFHPNEIQYWQENFDVIDFLLAYPIITETDAIKLCTAAQRNPNVKITAMVDSIQHLEILETCAKNADVTLSICIDCDMGFPFLTQWAGVLRSPLNSIEKIINFAHESEKYPHLVFRGIMGYEAQEAGTSDQSFIMRKMKAQSRQSVNQKRKEIIIALKDAGFNPELVNGGGSGCFQKTAEEPDITEIGLGSGLIKSYIFDPIESMHNFQPSLFMALRIVRQPRHNVATAFSGGYYCSATGKSPQIIMPQGLKTTRSEDFGEVQTPILFDPHKIKLNIGDLVICRFAKAGEPMERFNEVLLLKDNEMIESVPTYRGTGLWLG